uniref:Uncharacterized protein n=1 Tax=Romanomermis culicivorax TaxID=13658 RepID=A0A915KTS8_ROMCU
MLLDSLLLVLNRLIGNSLNWEFAPLAIAQRGISHMGIAQLRIVHLRIDHRRKKILDYDIL